MTQTEYTLHENGKEVFTTTSRDVLCWEIMHRYQLPLRKYELLLRGDKMLLHEAGRGAYDLQITQQEKESRF